MRNVFTFEWPRNDIVFSLKGSNFELGRQGVQLRSWLSHS